MTIQLLASWQNFYIIVGAASATLTGLMFVVTTLIAGIEQQLPALNAGISAFNTPTVVHFCVTLLMAAILSAPWQANWNVSLLLGLIGLGGTAYLIFVMQRMRHVPGYQTPMKDWLWYFLFPLIPYVVLIAAAVAFISNPTLALYLVSSVMVVLLFISIHNAWDLVTYLAVERSHPENKSHE